MKDLFGNFFQDKRILVTGHTGFIGSWLSIWLKELGAEVIGYALPPHSKHDNYVVTNLENKIVSIIGDIRNYEKLNDIFKKNRPEIVFHLAAQPIVRKSYTNPKETYDINIGGTVNVFEAFRRNDNSKILINFTTDKCYENKDWVWGYRENDRLGGYDPYSSSKACSEMITSAYRRSFFQAGTINGIKMVSSVRCGNIIGGGDWQEDRLIPDCMRAIKNNTNIILRNPESIRPWQFVLEPIRGLIMLALKMCDGNNLFSGAWNFGPHSSSIHSVKDIVERIISYLGKGNYKSHISQSSDDLHESEVLLLDINKSFRYLSWKPLLSIDQTIRFLCDWYVQERVNYEFDVNQIKLYLKTIIK